MRSSYDLVRCTRSTKIFRENWYDISGTLGQIAQLAQSLGIRGTPAFIVDNGNEQPELLPDLYLHPKFWSVSNKTRMPSQARAAIYVDHI